MTSGFVVSAAVAFAATPADSWLTATKIIAAVAAAVTFGAAIAQMSGYNVKDWLAGRRDTKPAEMTAEVSARLLRQVRSRSSGQIEALVATTGMVPLNLEPDIELVRPPVDRRPALPPVELIEGAYSAGGGRLLIVGDQGSGKTVLLYRLIQMLATAADSDDTAPIPILFNLSGWNPDRTIAEWVIDRLCDPNAGGYDLGDRRLAGAQVDCHRFALMFDGLDEVHRSNREACTNALNEFLNGLPDTVTDHTPIVVTCRAHEYSDMTGSDILGRLGHLVGYKVLPLNEATVADNLGKLAASNPQWERLLSREGTAARAALSSPLMLSLAAQIDEPSTLLGRTEAEIEHMVVHRFVSRQLTGDGRYDPQDSRRWLRWIAKFLRSSEEERTTFFLENIPGPMPGEQRSSRSPFARLAVDQSAPPRLRSFARRMMSIDRTMATLQDSGLPPGPTAGVAIGLGAAALVGTTVALLTDSLVRGIAAGLSVGIAAGLRAWRHGTDGRDARPRSIAWQRESHTDRYGLGKWYAAVLRLGVGLGVAGWALRGREGLVAAAILCIPAAAVAHFAARLLRAPVAADDGRVDGAYRASKRSFTAVAITTGVSAGLASGALLGLRPGIVVGLATGLTTGLNRGGRFVTRQWLRRRKLRRAGSLPSDPEAFLVWAAERQLMRRVGGGFQFRHLALRDLLADEFDEPAGSVRGV